MQNQYITIRQLAKANRISEGLLRRLQKQGRLPGVYSGTRFYVNCNQLFEMLERDSSKNAGSTSAEAI